MIPGYLVLWRSLFDNKFISFNFSIPSINLADLSRAAESKTKDCLSFFV